MLKVNDKMIKDVVSKVAGEDTIPIVMNIKGKVNVSEFKIAEDLNIEIRELRKKLYRLLEHNLVVFKRKKDKKRGWYIYYWTFMPSQVKFLNRALRERRLEMLKKRLDRELNNQFYICPNGCVRLDFARAVEFDFRCPECGSLLVVQDNSATVRHLREEIEKLEKELKEINLSEEKHKKSVERKVSKAKKMDLKRKKSKAHTKKGIISKKKQVKTKRSKSKKKSSRAVKKTKKHRKR